MVVITCFFIKKIKAMFSGKFLKNKYRNTHPNMPTYNIVAKLSLVRIMSAASQHTSVPLLPIAMPMSALFNATASLVPSPVMATM